MQYQLTEENISKFNLINRPYPKHIILDKYFRSLMKHHHP